MNRHLILPNCMLLFNFIRFKYSNLVNWCWLILLRMIIMSAQHRWVKSLIRVRRRNHQQQMNQRIANLLTSLGHCFCNGCHAICMFCGMVDVSWYIRRSRKGQDGGFWCTEDYLVRGHLTPSWWLWLGSASHMYSVNSEKTDPTVRKKRT